MSADVCRLEMLLSTARVRQQFLRHRLRRLDLAHNQAVYGAEAGAEEALDGAPEHPLAAPPAVGSVEGAAAAELAVLPAVGGVDVAVAAVDGAAGAADVARAPVAAKRKRAGPVVVDGVRVCRACANDVTHGNQFGETHLRVPPCLKPAVAKGKGRGRGRGRGGGVAAVVAGAGRGEGAVADEGDVVGVSAAEAGEVQEAADQAGAVGDPAS